MNATLLKALGLLLAAGTVFTATLIFLLRKKSLALFLFLTGAGCWILVALIHVCEALKLFPLMGWGQQRSSGHYLDLTCAVLVGGLILAGLVTHAIAKWRS